MRLKKSRVLLTVYCIMASFLVADALLRMLNIHPGDLGFIRLGGASFLGAMLASGFAASRLHEEVLGAVLAGLMPLAMGHARLPGEEFQFLTVSTPISTALICIGFALAGSRLGARYQLAQRATSLVCAAALLGAFGTHFVVIDFLSTFSNKLALYLALAALPVTPIVVGAVLQSQSREPIESSFVRGLAALTVFITLIAALNAHEQSAFVLTLLCGLAIASTVVYGFSLLGILRIRRLARWLEQTPELPGAVVREVAHNRM